MVDHKTRTRTRTQTNFRTTLATTLLTALQHYYIDNVKVAQLSLHNGVTTRTLSIIKPFVLKLGWLIFTKNTVQQMIWRWIGQECVQIWIKWKLPLKNLTIKLSFHSLCCRYCGMTQIQETLNSIIFSGLVYILHKTVFTMK